MGTESELKKKRFKITVYFIWFICLAFINYILKC